MSQAPLRAVGGLSPARDAIIVDTGFLVSLFDVREPLHRAATAWLAANRHALCCSPAVAVEAAHFLPEQRRVGLARLYSTGVVRVHAPDAAGYGRMAQLLAKYADLDPDWADIELLWLAEATGVRRIATLDTADFGIYRIHGRQRFDIVWPR